TVVATSSTEGICRCCKRLCSSAMDSKSVGRFSWVFFLATKDETSTILKTFITGIKNQINLKVKIIRSDNGTEFKNQDLNQFCGMKGIKREFSVARTPKQNVIAKRKNRTLIEAARTMLEDSLLPIPFCAEAVNTTCYVQYRVLVTKPHNKTPYELLLGRTPSIGFMRPFGCPVTILNTLDPLSKFDGKADEGFLVGYSVGSRPTWLFDIDTLTKSMNYQLVVVGNQLNSSAGIQEHFDAGSRPTWLFDIDTLTKSMNYQLVVVGNQLNSSAGIQEHFDAGVRNLREEFEEFSFNSTNKVNAASTPVTAVELNSTNSTNNFSAAGPSSNAVSSNFEIGGKSLFVDPSQYPDNLAMPALEEITYLDEDENVGAKADFSNLETNITVSPILTTRVHKDHPVTQMIGDLSLAPQTRSMTRMVKEQGGLTQINNDDFYTCMFTCFPSQEEPKREEAIDYEEVFAPVARIKAIRLFLAYASFMGLMVYQMDVKSPFLYGTIEEKVYVCQPPGFKDPDYPDKVYKVVKPLYGLHQAPRAWYETLANYIVDNGFQRGKINQTLFIKKQKGNILLVQVYVDNIIFGSTNKDLCKAFEKLMKDKFQMSSICELTFFLGLQVKQKQDGIFICQDKYVAKILTKFGLTDGKSASTPIDTKKPLRKDPDGEDVDVHTYKSMIGSLMYLTLSRPNIMFAVCACVRFHVTPKASHLHAVKQIFSYLKGKPHLGLWYPKDSPFNLVAYSNSDYTIVATSSTDAKYVAAASCCAQVLWVQNQLLDYGTPSIGFMRPFGCHVTILNNLDPLGKFDGKVDEGFLVGYSNTDDDAAFEIKESEFEGRKTESKVHVFPSSKFEDFFDNSINEVNVADSLVLAVGQISTNNTNTFSAAGPSNTAVSPTQGKSSYVDTSQYPDDPNMTELEDITYSDDEDEELLQFKMHKVWVLVERGIVVRNKARLVAQGHTQEEGIDYKEVFAPVARIEAIRLFLAYASFMGFMVYQMDVKSAFLYETIEEEIYVCQPLGFKDPDYPDKKPDGIFISQDKYVAKIIRKFGLTDAKSASTPIDTEKPLLKDPDGEDVDVHTYILMIGSLMYLISSRPDIMFSVCACAHFQVTPKVSHLHAVKRIFRHLKGKTHLGLWYPKDSPFNLVAYSNSDYAGASLDRKSTTGGCQFLGCRLIS
nr:putative ribonuclease H-like domain-containing protein [Tanacetum cinerariifolium]